MDEKAALADFYIPQVVDRGCEVTHRFFILSDEIEREPDRLTRSDRGQFRKFVSDTRDGMGEFHLENAIILTPLVAENQ